MKIKWLYISIVFIYLLVFTALGRSVTVEDHPESFVENYARIDWHQVVAPIGKLLLVKKDNKYCAIRFTEFHKGNYVKAIPWFREGKYIEYAEYDWYFQDDGSGIFTKPNVKHGHGKLVDKPLKGILGQPLYKGGNVHIECGFFKLFWLYPTSVSFSSHTACSDLSAEIAPTNISEINKVSIDDPDITWYKCDEKRESFLIPIEQLK